MSGAATAATWAGGALTTIGGVLLSPWVLAAAAVGGIGYVGYKLYKKLSYLGFLRMAQYGFREDRDEDKEYIEKTRKLENLLEDHVIFGTSGEAKLGSKIPWGDILDEMGYTADNTKGIDQFQSWVNNRFAPVYLAHRKQLDKLDPKRSLDNIDHMDDELHIPFVEAVIGAIPSRVLNWTAHPFRGAPLPSNEDEIARLKELIYKRAGKLKENRTKPSGPYQGGGVATPATTSITSGSYSYTTQAPVQPKPKASEQLKANVAAGVKPTEDSNKPTSPTQPTQPGNAPVGVANNGVAPKTTAKAQAASAAPASVVGNGARNGDIYLVDEALVEKSKIEAIKAGNFIWSEASNSSIDALASVRMRAYGLTLLEVNDIAALTGLEQDVSEHIKYGFFGGAEAEVDANEYYLKYAAVFGCSPSNKEQQQTWTYWFTKRFVPVLLTFHEAIKRTKVNTTIKDAWRTLKPANLLKVALAIISATTEVGGRDLAVWTIAVSPFPGRVPNTDSTSTDVAIEGLKAQDRQEQAQEKIDKAKKPQPGFTEQAQANQHAGGYGSWWSRQSAPAYGPGGIGMQGGLGSSSYSYNTPAPGGSSGGESEDSNYTPGAGYDHPGKGSGGDINSLPVPQGDGAKNVMPLLLAVAKMVGVDPHLLATMCAVESDFKISAKADTSSASGLFQFISGTWKDVIRKYGDRYGISPNATRNDPRANALMGAEYIRENYESLARSIGRKPNANDLYLAHFLGAGGAKKVLKGNPDELASRLNPDAAASNRSVFFKDNGNGAPRTVRELQAEIDRRMKMKTKAYSIDTLAQSPDLPAPDKTSFDVTATDKGELSQTTTATGGTTSGDAGMSAIKKKADEASTKAPLAAPNLNGSGGSSVTPPTATRSSTSPSVQTPAAAAATENAAQQTSQISKAQEAVEQARAQARAQQAASSRKVAADNASSQSLAERQLATLTSIDGRLVELVGIVKGLNVGSKQSTTPAAKEAEDGRRELRPENRKSPVALGSR